MFNGNFKEPVDVISSDPRFGMVVLNNTFKTFV